jgi:hypothetical protein
MLDAEPPASPGVALLGDGHLFGQILSIDRQSPQYERHIHFPCFAKYTSDNWCKPNKKSQHLPYP